ncbi:hypothetical protein [Paenibacillus macerans]|uniref:hypothetical protein n=1 Tax=Paenibacillus macerans TaxID=44252 RepID=UPI0022E988A6|nr:hypothetical protein [Paenibacillus macerans]
MSIITTFDYGNKKYAVGEEAFHVLDSNGHELESYPYQQTTGAGGVSSQGEYFDSSILSNTGEMIIKLPDTDEAKEFYLAYLKQRNKF